MEQQTDVPEYFLCPISLQIMSDPVTTITGITYERRCIEQWLSASSSDTVCPVTKQPLDRSSPLTPNHTLRRLINSWSLSNTNNNRNPAPPESKPLDTDRFARIVNRMADRTASFDHSEELKELETLAAEGEGTRQRLVESGTADFLVKFINRSRRDNRTAGLRRPVKILNQIWSPTAAEIRRLILENHGELIESISWILDTDADRDLVLRSQATLLAKRIFEIGGVPIERLGVRFIRGLIRILRDSNNNSHDQATTTKSALRVLVESSQCGKNRQAMIESDAVFALIETELRTTKDKKSSEMVFCLLSQLCSTADGRAQLLAHAAGIAVITKRLLRVSAEVDDRAVRILSAVARFSATTETLTELLRVGTVSKLCMVLQTDGGRYVKDKVREILRMHYSVWNNSPCIQVYLLTRYPALQF